MPQQPTLVIMAAGLGSRYGGLKQLDGIGTAGETIMEYSIYDAIRAGFGKVVLIVKENFLHHLKKILNKKLKDKIPVEYAVQELQNIPGHFPFHKERKKPWGTGHAIWITSEVVNTNFAVINADDFYGFEAFVKMQKFLSSQCNEKTYAMVGYKLKNTVSKHGGVSRGICQVKENNLLKIKECHNIHATNGKLSGTFNDQSQEFAKDSLTSMNFWGFPPSIYRHLLLQFSEFLKKNSMTLKEEFYIPTVVDNLLKNKEISVKVLATDAKWYGITYKEDRDRVEAALKQYVKDGFYPTNLWA